MSDCVSEPLPAYWSELERARQVEQLADRHNFFARLHAAVHLEHLLELLPVRQNEPVLCRSAPQPHSCAALPPALFPRTSPSYLPFKYNSLMQKDRHPTSLEPRHHAQQAAASSSSYEEVEVSVYET